MTNAEFTEMVKAIIKDCDIFFKEFVWQGIIANFEEKELDEKEIEYWVNGGDGDVIVDKIFEKMLDTIEEI